MNNPDLLPYVHYRCVVGSRAYGLDREGSDFDRRGFYLPPARLHWSLFAPPEQLEDEEAQECYWEIGKFLRLALKNNPNVLECLHSPIVEHASPIAQELLEIRGRLLSKRAYATYLGYAEAQFVKLRNKRELTGEVNWRHATHLIRLLQEGIYLMRHGTVRVRVGQERNRLLAIKDGQVPWEEIEAIRQTLERELQASYKTTSLPEEPDFAAADAFLVKARRSMIDE